MAGRKKWRPRTGKHNHVPSYQSSGSWIVEYECGLTVNFPPAPSEKIENIVRKAGHVCSREKCKPIWYRRKQ